MSDKHYIGLDLVSFEDSGQYKPVSRVTLFVDDENCYTAGDDAGMELTAECPSATQEMANSILAKLKGHQYRAYNAGAANLDPAAELGDGVTVGGLYSTISSLADDGEGFPDISAPGEAELEEEFPSESPLQKSFDRKIARTRSEITKTAEAIRLEVTSEINGIEEAFAYLELTVDGLNTKVQDAEGNISSLEQTASSITASVGDLELRMDDIEGLTVTDSSGTTRIKGSSIETSTLKVSSANITGTLTASQIDATNLKVSAANVTGTLSANQFKMGGQMSVYQTIDSNNLGGYFGYMDVSVSTAGGGGFSGKGLGINAAGHAMILAPSGNLAMVSYGNVYMGSSMGRIELSGTDLYFNGKSLYARLLLIESLLGITVT